MKMLHTTDVGFIQLSLNFLYFSMAFLAVYCFVLAKALREGSSLKGSLFLFGKSTS
jgi:hypothetical protein